MNVTFYSFSKRRNSTKVPASTGTVVTCKLKEPCSLKNPRLLLSGNLFTTYDYAYIGDFGRYYFVSDVVSVGNGLTEITLECDVLASHKTAIGSTVARIAFSSNGWNAEYIDNRINCSASRELYQGAVTTADMIDDNYNGYYVLSVINDDAVNSFGFATCYALDYQAMADFRAIFANLNFSQGVQDNIRDYLNGNVMNAVISCNWVPFKGSQAMPSGAVNTNQINILTETFSNFTTGQIYRLPSDTTKEKTYSVAFPTYGYADFRRAEPYTTGQIFLPGIGCADLCMADWVGCQSITVDNVIDYATGDISYYLRNPNNSTIVQSFTTNAAADCPLGHVTRNMGGVLSSVGGAAGGIVTGIVGAVTENPMMMLSGAAAAVAGAASTVLQYNKRAVSLKGGITGKSSTYFPGFFINMYKTITEDPTDGNYIAMKGRPVCVTHAISNHSGYVQCDGASVSIAGDAFERDEINSFLNTGFFYE